MAVAETLKRRRSFLVLFERGAELRWNRQFPGTFRLGFGRLLYAFIIQTLRFPHVGEHFLIAGQILERTDSAELTHPVLFIVA